MRRTALVSSLLLAFALLLASCDFLENGAPNASGTGTPPLPTPADTPVAAADVSTPAPDIAASPPALTFTLWTVPEISPSTEVPGGAVLLEQLNAFDVTHPDLRLFVELKAESGQGGVLSYLRTGRGVAPGVLPDVVLLPADLLPAAATDGLIYALDDLSLDSEMLDDLLPAARGLVTLGDSVYAYPLALTDLGHIAYDGNSITSTIPMTWQGFSSLANGSFVFPAAGVDGATMVLQLYLDNGGTLTDASGAPRLEVGPLTEALRELAGAVDTGYVLPTSAEITTLAESWQVFQAGASATVQTNADQYLAQRNLGISAGFAPVPGSTGSLSPLTGAWVLAVTTADPARQAIAAELIGWLGSATNMGEWTRQSGRVPARRTAFEAWPADDPYANFLRLQVELAEPFPPAATSAILSALSQAAAAVIQDTSSPAAAAQAAAATIQP